MKRSVSRVVMTILVAIALGAVVACSGAPDNTPTPRPMAPTATLAPGETPTATATLAPGQTPTKAEATPTATEPAAATGGPVYGGILRYSWENDAPGLSPITDTSITRSSMWGAMYDRLWAADGYDMATRSEDLVKSWEWRADGTELHVTLHGGIKFHDGVPLTANDVKDRYVITECEPSAGRSQGRNVTSILIGNYPDRDCDDFMSDDPTYGIKIVDDLNFIFKLSRPSKTFIDMLYTTRVAPSHILRKDDDTPRDMGKVDTPEDNIGTGPFVFVSYDRGSVFKVERNPDYWKTDPRNGNGQLPYLDGIHTFIIPDISTRFAAFRAGQIELTPVNSRSISFDQARVISNNMQGEATVSYGDKSRNNFLAFNHLRSPYDDVRVRRALFLAIDRKAICEVMVEGHCTFATHLPPVLPARFGDALNDEPGYRYPKDEDLAEAERLLDEAGLPRGEDGVRWVQELPVRPGGADEYVNLSLLFQAQFREIGVEMRLNPMELGAFDGRRRVRDYDVLPLGGIKNNLNALGNSGYWGPGNGYNCESPERDALFTAADTATDPLAYAEIVTDLETWLMDNMCAYTPIAWLEYPLGMWNNIKNHNPHVIREDHHNAMQVTWKEAGT